MEGSTEEQEAAAMVEKTEATGSEVEKVWAFNYPCKSLEDKPEKLVLQVNARIWAIGASAKELGRG